MPNEIEDTSTTEVEVPQAVTEKFAEIFGPDPDAAPASRARPSDSAAQQDELEEEGLQGPENPDGAAKVEDAGLPAVPDGEDEPAEEPEVAEEEEVPAIDPRLTVAAGLAGITNEQLEKLVAADPAAAATLLESVAQQQLALSQRYLSAPANQVAAEIAPTSPTPKLDLLMKGLKEFAEVNGDGLTDQFVKPLFDEIIEPVRRMMASMQVQQNNAVKAEAMTTMEGLVKDLPDFYGADPRALTPMQVQTRRNLAWTADQLRAGAERMGVSLSVGDAMKQAHLTVTAHLQHARARQQISKSLEKRAKTLTARPSTRTSGVSNNKSIKAAEEAYARKASELGISVDTE
jgi:chorismate mutase